MLKLLLPTSKAHYNKNKKKFSDGCYTFDEWLAKREAQARARKVTNTNTSSWLPTLLCSLMFGLLCGIFYSWSDLAPMVDIATSWLTNTVSSLLDSTTALTAWTTTTGLPAFWSALPYLGMPASYLLVILASIWLPPILDPNPQPATPEYSRRSRRRYQQAMRRWRNRRRFKTASIKDTNFHKSYPRRLRSTGTYWTKAPDLDQQHLLHCMSNWFHHSSTRKAGHNRDREWHGTSRRKGDGFPTTNLLTPATSPTNPWCLFSFHGSPATNPWLIWLLWMQRREPH